MVEGHLDPSYNLRSTRLEYSLWKPTRGSSLRLDESHDDRRTICVSATVERRATRDSLDDPERYGVVDSLLDTQVGGLIEKWGQGVRECDPCFGIVFWSSMPR